MTSKEGKLQTQPKTSGCLASGGRGTGEGQLRGGARGTSGTVNCSAGRCCGRYSTSHIAEPQKHKIRTVNPNTTSGPQLITRYQFWFSNSNQYATIVQDVNWETPCKQDAVQRTLLPEQFFCELKTALKWKSIRKIRTLSYKLANITNLYKS